MAQRVEEPVEEQRTADAPAPRERGARGLTGAILLIALGVALLLDNLGVISVDWLGLLRFWPVILVLIGLDLLLGRSVLGSLLAALVGLTLVIGLIVLASEDNRVHPTGRTITRQIARELGEARDLQVTLNLGASQTRVGPLSGSDYAIQGDYTTDEILTITADYRLRGDTGVLILSQESPGRGAENIPIVGELNLGLTTAVPIALSVDTGFGDVTLDLSGMKIRSLDVTAGVGNMVIILPEAGDFDATVEAGVGNIEIHVPPSLAAAVDVEGGLSNIDMDSMRFRSTGEDHWETPGFDSASDQVEIAVEAGIGNISIGD